MRALKFITGHVIFKLRYNEIYQLKTTHIWDSYHSDFKKTDHFLNETLPLFYLIWDWFLSSKQTLKIVQVFKAHIQIHFWTPEDKSFLVH